MESLIKCMLTVVAIAAGDALLSWAVPTAIVRVIVRAAESSLYASEDPDARELYTDASWLMKVGIVGASQSDAAIVEAAQADNDGDGYSNEVETKLGTDPNDANSKLQVTITPGENGQFVIDWSPEVSGLDYRLMGVTELGGDWKDITDLSEEERSMNGYKFFKVKVNVNQK